MSNRRVPLKPTGQISGRYLDFDAKGGPALYPTGMYKLPENKIEAEIAVMEATALNLPMLALPYLFNGYRKHEKENGPDFDISLVGYGTGYAELTELAVLSGPFHSAPKWIEVGCLVDRAVKLVREKQKKYENRPYRPLLLIIYASHETFSPTQAVFEIIANDIAKIDTSAFYGVVLTTFGFRGGSVSYVVSPTKRFVPRLRRRMLRKLPIFRFDPSLIEIREVENTESVSRSVTLRFHFPKGIDVREAIRSVNAGVCDLPFREPSEETKKQLNLSGTP